MSRQARLKPIDVLAVVFMAMLLTLTLIFHGRIPCARTLALRYAGAILLVVLASRAHRRFQANPVIKYADVLMPIFIILFTFDSLGQLTRYINPPDKDPLLAGLDLALFGVHPGIWMQALIDPALTTVLQVCYTSYYFIPIAFCLMLYFQGETKAFDRSVFGVVFGFFVSYVGYIAVPALGPRFYMADLFDKDLMRGPLANAINDTLNMLEGENRDAFPSGHTEVVLIVLTYAWSYRRWYFWLASPLVAGLIFSTVYLRYHYAVDVLAGVLLAPASVWAADRIYGRERVP